MPEISIIIPTFNSIGFIKPCLGRIFDQERHDFETIVVDNGSTDGTADFIKENYPQVVLIENWENLGAAKAKNQGIEIAKSKWILTLDCDIVLEKDFLSRMGVFVNNVDQRVGMLQPKVLRMDKKTVSSCGITFSNLIRFDDIGKGVADEPRFNKIKYVFGPSCAAAFYNRRMLEELKEETGYFDERFFFMVEDVDLAWRAQRKGWKALFYPEGVCYHNGNSSSTGKSLRKFLCWRNRKLMLQKFPLNRSKLFLVSLFYDFPRFTYLFLTNHYVRKEAGGHKTVPCLGKR